MKDLSFTRSETSKLGEKEFPFRRIRGYVRRLSTVSAGILRYTHWKKYSTDARAREGGMDASSGAGIVEVFRVTKKDAYSFETLSMLFDETAARPLKNADKYVIFSDLHMGTGRKTDDFRSNAQIFVEVLRRRYLPEGYTLILNGDVEELQRFTFDSIRRRWVDVYDVFDEFERDGRFIRIVGNHDLALSYGLNDIKPHDAVTLDYHGNKIFIFHGHQTASRYIRHHALVGLVLKYIANPLKIKNYTVAHDSRKKFKTEKRVYEFANANKIIAVIGHTHRPLFESMSKIDSLKFEVERLCRKYPKSSDKKKGKIEHKITLLKSELDAVVESEEKYGSHESLYRENLVVPCMFNSGSVLGKRGITGLELTDGEIGLVHWFDRRKSKKYLQYENYQAHQLGDTDYFQVIIKRDNLSYIFSRIKLLA